MFRIVLKFTDTYMSMAICRYMLFTPMDGTHEDSAWLPVIPAIGNKKARQDEEAQLV